MAYQYWQQRGRPREAAVRGARRGVPRRHRGLGLGGRHGPVPRASSADCSSTWSGCPRRIPTAGPAAATRSRSALARGGALLEAKADELAALVVEPLVQGAAGMLMQPPGYLRALAELCRQARRAAHLRRGGDRLRPHRDDVRGGAGGRAPGLPVPGEGAHRRLPAAGRDAHHRARVYRPSSATSPRRRTFFHGHTYTGNPLACAAALANLGCSRPRRVLERDEAGRPRCSAEGLAAHRRAAARGRRAPARIDGGHRAFA